jgi:anti-sigma regulatory factor (Ser/Thr protein kinase)
MEISDNGPGIEDINKAMQSGYSTASDQHREMGFGAGMGLPNMQKNSDEIEVSSEKGRGTRVHMVFFLNSEGEKD